MADSVQSHQREDSEGDDYQRDDDWQDNAGVMDRILLYFLVSRTAFGDNNI